VPSTFTWLDYSEQHRRRMLDVIDLFAEPDTRDELGIGSVPDAFAEALFPGVSVVQRRARYLLFVPWIYLDLERRGVPSAQAADRARRAETALINVLAEEDDHDGTIGIQAREKLKRLPSNVYWQALGRYGIRVFPGHQDAYHRAFDLFHSRAAAHRSRARERDDPAEEASPHNWHPGLPAAPDRYRGLLNTWAGELAVTSGDLGHWARVRFWEIVASSPGRVGLPTRAFVDSWLNLVLARSGAVGADDAEARQLIEARERQLKGPLARRGDPRALELWRGASGAGRLNYRWYTAQVIVADIQDGLVAEVSDA
jgi:hypothetical protein